PPSDGYVLALYVSGAYNSPSGAAAVVVAEVDQSAPVVASLTAQGFGQSSPGCPSTVDMGVTKSDGGISVHPGGVVPYTIGYTNQGSGSATGVVLTETVPAGTAWNAAASSAGWSCGGGGTAGATCTYGVGFVGPGGSGAKVFAV